MYYKSKLISFLSGDDLEGQLNDLYELGFKVSFVLSRGDYWIEIMFEVVDK